MNTNLNSIKCNFKFTGFEGREEKKIVKEKKKNLLLRILLQ